MCGQIGDKMAFDAGMLAAVIYELKSVAQGGRIEKYISPRRTKLYYR